MDKTELPSSQAIPLNKPCIVECTTHRGKVITSLLITESQLVDIDFSDYEKSLCVAGLRVGRFYR